MQPIEHILKIFKDARGIYPDEINKLSGSGSDREYFLLTLNKEKELGVYSPNIKENKTFIALAETFGREGINVPNINYVNEKGNCYLEEYLGENSLLDYLNGEKRLQNDKRIELAKKSLKELLKMQLVKESLWDKKVFEPPFSRQLIISDLHYFKYCLLKPLGIFFDDMLLEEDFMMLSEHLLRPSSSPFGFMFRDFQSRNIIIKDDTPRFIDFQGGRKGPVVYDLVSFLWQAKAGFTPEEKEILIKYYLDLLDSEISINKETVANSVPLYALFRILQTLGAYGFRGIHEGKKHFIESLPIAAKNLKDLLEEKFDDKLPELQKISHRLDKAIKNLSINRNKDPLKKEVSNDHPLKIIVRSFSYKKHGYPKGHEIHGGGFVFDCRGLPNPGRYEQFQGLTGKDSAVKAYLDSFKEPDYFIDRAVSLVSISIDEYLNRKFDSLEVNFGCTGGQHRSVWCAERFAREIEKKYSGIKIKVSHLREHNPEEKE